MFLHADASGSPNELENTASVGIIVHLENLIEVAKRGKLHQEIMGYRKKNKLEIGMVTMEQVAEWIQLLDLNT